jgi:hypothetical protein
MLTKLSKLKGRIAVAVTGAFFDHRFRRAPSIPERSMVPSSTTAAAAAALAEVNARHVAQIFHSLE